MDKIPIGHIIGQSYRFSFRGYFTVLGIVWLPGLLLLAAAYFLMVPMMHEFAGIMRNMIQHPGDPAAALAMQSTLSRVYGFDFLVLLFMIWIQVGVTKEILGLRTGPRFVYLPSGADEGRVLLSYIVLIILAYLAIAAVAVVAVLIGLACYAIFASGLASGFDPRTLGAGFVVVPFLLIYFAILYVFVRLLYFVGPATVAERQMILNRSWQLTRGNFWRIFAILLATLLPIYLAEIVLMGAAAIPMIHQLVAMRGNADPTAIFAAIWAGMARLLLYYAAVGFLVAPFFYGLLIAPAAFAYRALVPAKPPEDAPAA
jgi:hypothetical protein